MPVAKKLLEEIDAFALRNPGHQASVDALRSSVQRIDAEFAGKSRALLLGEARKTFLRQIQTLESADRTLDALKTLQANQHELLTALKKLAHRRPEGATLH